MPHFEVLLFLDPTFVDVIVLFCLWLKEMICFIFSPSIKFMRPVAMELFTFYNQTADREHVSREKSHGEMVVRRTGLLSQLGVLFYSFGVPSGMCLSLLTSSCRVMPSLGVIIASKWQLTAWQAACCIYTILTLIIFAGEQLAPSQGG